jgi:D-tyrosyl-tRNA(Tyr) deacylase
MIALLQRARDARVDVGTRTTGAIDAGLLILLGVFEQDTTEDADYLIDKASNLRIFNDDSGKMNLSVRDTGGSALIVSQFTLCADTKKGRRPSYINAAGPEKATELYEYFLDNFAAAGIPVESGEFGAMMDVHLVNTGPVTIILDSKNR